MDHALHRKISFAKKYYALRNFLRNLRNIQAKAQNVFLMKNM